MRGFLFVAAFSVASAFTPGCFFTDMRYTDPVGSPTVVSNATACQNLCDADENSTCKGFTYFPNSGECWFSASGQSDQLIRDASSRCYSGPPACASPPPACPVSINGTWPGADVAASDAAFNVGFQPGKLQCWPKFSYNGSYAGCADIKVLDDKDHGWPGKCLGLTQATLVGNQTCEAKCKSDLMCPGYQLGNDGTCWTGVGKGCYGAAPWNSSWSPVAAKRFQRGEVKVVKTLVGIHVLGLRHVFDKANADAMGANASLQCAKVCYSVFDCQYWQLSNETGCYVELPDVQRVAYPLTAANAPTNTPLASKMFAGEYIQRMCLTPVLSTTVPPPTMPPFSSPTAPSTTTTTTTTIEAANILPLWGWLLIVLLFCCCLAALGVALMYCGGRINRKPKTKKARNLERAQTSEQSQSVPSVPLIEAQPVPAQVSPVPMYTQATAGYSAVPTPVPTEYRAMPMVTPAVQQPVAQPPPMAPQPQS